MALPRYAIRKRLLLEFPAWACFLAGNGAGVGGGIRRATAWLGGTRTTPKTPKTLKAQTAHS